MLSYLLRFPMTVGRTWLSVVVITTVERWRERRSSKCIGYPSCKSLILTDFLAPDGVLGMRFMVS
jgi:hypothetical protein